MSDEYPLTVKQVNKLMDDVFNTEPPELVLARKLKEAGFTEHQVWRMFIARNDEPKPYAPHFASYISSNEAIRLRVYNFFRDFERGGVCRRIDTGLIS